MSKKKTAADRIKRIEDHLGISDRETTEIVVVQDRSGSMEASRLTQPTIDGFNEFLAKQRENKDDDAFLTLIQFDHEYSVRYKHRPIAKVKDLNKDTYVPRGTTALYDAIGQGVKEIAGSDATRKIVLIMTDGGENASAEYTWESIKNLIEEKQAEDDWTFVFMGAGVDEMAGMKLGIAKGNIWNYQPTAHDHSITYGGMSMATSALRSSGTTSTASFTSTMVEPTSDPDKLWTPGDEDDDDDDKDGSIA